MILLRFETPLWSTFGDNSRKKDVPKFDAKICDFKGSRVLGRGGGGGPIDYRIIASQTSEMRLQTSELGAMAPNTPRRA